jgi:hypothetical protein
MSSAEGGHADRTATRQTVVWLLDVDGVINVSRPGWGESPSSGYAYSAGIEFPIRWAAGLVARIRSMHRAGTVSVRWCSTWCADADQIENLLGLPVFDRAWTDRLDAGQATFAKLATARGVLARGDRLVWTDDRDVPTSGAIHKELVKPGRALLIAPTTQKGLQPDHLDQIEKFALAVA